MPAPHARHLSRAACAASLSLAGLLLAACGGGTPAATSTTAATTTSTGPTTTVAPTTTTLAKLPIAADPAALALARPGAIVLGDLTAAWKEASPATDPLTSVSPVGLTGCALGKGTPALPAPQAVVSGATFERGDTKHFASSNTYAFADEATAKTAIESFRSASVTACRLDALNVEERAAQATTTTSSTAPGEVAAVKGEWKASPINDDGRGQGGLEGQVQLYFEATLADGKTEVSASDVVTLYRYGRIVEVTFENERSGSETEAEAKVADDEVYKALLKAVDRIRAAKP